MQCRSESIHLIVSQIRETIVLSHKMQLKSKLLLVPTNNVCKVRTGPAVLNTD